MKKTFKIYLREERGVDELIDAFKNLKVLVTRFLHEENSSIPINKRLKLLGIFEQFFRHLKNINMDVNDVPGFGSLVDKASSGIYDDTAVEKIITDTINNFNNGHFINFPNIANRRMLEFEDWYDSRKHDGLEIINDSLDYVLRELSNYRLASIRLGRDKTTIE